MRFALTIPDRIGDLVMRQPMLAALAGRGHSVALVMPSFTVPLVPLVAPQADVFPFYGNPYTPDFVEGRGRELTLLVDELRAWKPDAVVVAAHQRTALDEYIVAQMSPIRSIGMSGVLYPGMIEWGPAPTSKINFTQQVAVQEQDAELAKYEALCRALIGESITLPPPVLQIPETLSSGAIGWLANAGLRQGHFWVVCAGNDPGNRARNWQSAKWAEVCRTLITEFGMSLLFIGTPDEKEPVAEILRLMGSAAEHCVNVCEAPPATDLLCAILGHCAGYLGRDTGPMHIAAAVGKPVVAVFGGGHWFRCLPAAEHGAIVTCALPCWGCWWSCHFEESHCVKDVPVELVVQELRRVHTSDAAFRTVVVEPDMKRLLELGSEAAVLARARSRRLYGDLIAARAALKNSQAEVDALREEISKAEQRL